MKQIVRILKFSSHLWPYYVTVSVASVILALLSQVQPLLTKWAIDRLPSLVDGRVELGPVMLIVAAIFLSDLGATLISNVAGYYGDIMSARLSYFLSTRYYEHLLSLSQRYYTTELTGKIISRLNRSIQGVSDFINMFANNFLQFLLTTVFSLLIVARFSPLVALMFASLYPIFLYLTGRTSKKWQVFQTQINEANDVASGRFAEVIGQIKVAKSYVSEQLEARFFAKTLQKTIRLTKPQSKLWHREDIYRRVVLNIIFGLVYVYIFWQAVHGRFTVGEVVLLIQYGALIRLPIFSMSFLVDRTQRAITDSRDYFEAMNAQQDVLDAAGASSLVVGSGVVRFESVNFAYEDNQPVLSSVSFDLPAGHKTALVGESGEGKTTITNLLLRLYDPTAGQILIDDQVLTTVSQASLRRSIAVVFQEATLFSGTVRENIAYGKPKASLAEITAAARAGNAWAFIQKLPKGLDTLVGERGLKLSGGQKQRIAIARALLKDAPILVLDEATSSLDSRSEHEVQVALEKLMKGRTVLIIAHRLSTIASVDQIVTLRNGRVDEVGSPAQLSQTEGIYAQLLALQNRHDQTTEAQLKSYEIAG